MAKLRGKLLNLLVDLHRGSDGVESEHSVLEKSVEGGCVSLFVVQQSPVRVRHLLLGSVQGLGHLVQPQLGVVRILTETLTLVTLTLPGLGITGVVRRVVTNFYLVETVIRRH